MAGNQQSYANPQEQQRDQTKIRVWFSCCVQSISPTLQIAACYNCYACGPYKASRCDERCRRRRRPASRHDEDHSQQGHLPQSVDHHDLTTAEGNCTDCAADVETQHRAVKHRQATQRNSYMLLLPFSIMYFGSMSHSPYGSAECS